MIKENKENLAIKDLKAQKDLKDLKGLKDLQDQHLNLLRKIMIHTAKNTIAE